MLCSFHCVYNGTAYNFVVLESAMCIGMAAQYEHVWCIYGECSLESNVIN